MSIHRQVFPQSLTPGVINFITDSIRRSYDVLDLRIEDNTLEVSFREEVSGDDFVGLVQRLAFVCRSMDCKVLFENHPKLDCASKDDPLGALIRREDVQKIDVGTFLFAGDFLKLRRHFDEEWRQRALQIGAHEQEYPVLWPTRLYRKINYLAEFPHQVILASPVRSNHDDLTAISKKYTNQIEYEAIEMDTHMDVSRYGLQCAVCDICYYALEGARDYADTLYTTCNKVFRNESSATGSLDRLTNFTVRDIMFVGSRDFVLEWRQRMLDMACEFLQEVGLDARIATANDPFFTNDALVKSVFQNASELKHEMLARLPFSGQDLAIGSINLHQAFDIRLPGGEEAWSGCLGIGFERLVYAIYCQYGTEPRAWPAGLRALLEN